MKTRYSSNNSGGNWWLDDADWRALEAAGWYVDWRANRKEDSFGLADKDGRWLGALATGASREGLTLRAAIEEWESITGESSNALGCSCCGPPHNFTFEDDNGSTEYYSPNYPMFGDPY